MHKAAAYNGLHYTPQTGISEDNKAKLSRQDKCRMCHYLRTCYEGFNIVLEKYQPWHRHMIDLQ